MTALAWDQPGERLYETGIDHGVLYILNNGVYDEGVAWNGLTTVTESPTGAEPTPLYADNIKYLNLISAEQFGGTIEAYTYPDAFGLCDGTAVPVPGVAVAQQGRKSFGLCYRTRLGNDEDGADFAFKLHLVWSAVAAVSEKAYASINDSPDAITFSWAFSTTGVPVAGMKPTSVITIDSSKVDPAALADLEDILYGTVGADPRLPLPDEVIGLFSGSVTEAQTLNPTFVAATGVITIPSVTGVQYRRADTNAVVTGTFTIATAGAFQGIRATAAPGYVLSDTSDTNWEFQRTP